MDPADALQELAGDRLVLQGLLKHAVLDLRLVEQTRVLQGDGRVPGERRDQLDLALREFSRVSAGGRSWRR